MADPLPLKPPDRHSVEVATFLQESDSVKQRQEELTDVGNLSAETPSVDEVAAPLAVDSESTGAADWPPSAAERGAEQRIVHGRTSRSVSEAVGSEQQDCSADSNLPAESCAVATAAIEAFKYDAGGNIDRPASPPGDREDEGGEVAIKVDHDAHVMIVSPKRAGVADQEKPPPTVRDDILGIVRERNQNGSNKPLAQGSQEGDEVMFESSREVGIAEGAVAAWMASEYRHAAPRQGFPGIANDEAPAVVEHEMQKGFRKETMVGSELVSEGVNLAVKVATATAAEANEAMSPLIELSVEEAAAAVAEANEAAIKAMCTIARLEAAERKRHDAESNRNPKSQGDDAVSEDASFEVTEQKPKICIIVGADEPNHTIPVEGQVFVPSDIAADGCGRQSIDDLCETGEISHSNVRAAVSMVMKRLEAEPDWWRAAPQPKPQAMEAFEQRCESMPNSHHRMRSAAAEVLQKLQCGDSIFQRWDSERDLLRREYKKPPPQPWQRHFRKKSAVLDLCPKRSGEVTIYEQLMKLRDSADLAHSCARVPKHQAPQVSMVASSGTTKKKNALLPHPSIKGAIVGMRKCAEDTFGRRPAWMVEEALASMALRSDIEQLKLKATLFIDELVSLKKSLQPSGSTARETVPDSQLASHQTSVFSSCLDAGSSMSTAPELGSKELGCKKFSFKEVCKSSERAQRKSPVGKGTKTIGRNA